jgi:hypothetical protein
MSSSPTGAGRPPASPAAILSPSLDLLLLGGLSLVVFVPLLLSGRSDLLLIGAGAQAWVATVINMPHFMASYRLVYRSREMILRHKWASMYVPALLLLYIVLAVWQAQYDTALVVILVSVSSAYLAWHYTGQVWGMMASFAYLDGRPFDSSERLLIRTGLRILLAWHVTWFLHSQLRNPQAVRPLYLVLSAASIVALTLGVIGLDKMRRRTGRLPPLRVVVPWLAIFVWYAVMARDPNAIFWIQIAHALQYLAFPIRVEMNQSLLSPQRRGQRFALHMLSYGAVLLVASYVVAQVVPASAMSVVGDIFGDEPSRVAPVLILMFINIHHYFTDGAIWHIRNPEVRRELFAHVQAERGPASSERAGKHALASAASARKPGEMARR